jgi:hypothetical protein
MTRNREYTRQKHNLDKYGIPHPKDEKVEREKDQPAELPKGIERKGDRTVRTKETGDKVYLITGNTAQWVKSLETLNALGWRLGQEVMISLEELRKFEMGEPVSLKYEELVKAVKEVIATAEVPENKPVLNYRKSV